MSSTVARVFVEMDCLFDTRIGIIHKLWPDKAAELASKPEYFKRINDKFDGIIENFPQQDFEDTYSRRTYEHIAGSSVMTSVVSKLKMYSRATMAQNVSLVEECRTELVVNTYPYKVPSGDLEELKTALMYSTEFEEVRFVSLALPFLTPAHMRTYRQFIIYDFDQWINLHGKDLVKSPIPEVEAIHPYIQHKDMGMSPIEVIEDVKRTLEPAIDVCPWPLDDFSFVIPV